MYYGETKKLSDENQRFDWIKSIHCYRLANIHFAGIHRVYVQKKIINQ